MPLLAGLYGTPTPGSPIPLGAALTPTGVNFAVYAAPGATSVSLCVFTPEDLANGAGPTAEIQLDPLGGRQGLTYDHISASCERFL
jgi:hypothetical protein